MEVRNTKRIVEHIRIDSLNFLFRCLKDLGILIPRQLDMEQYIKLFSNPVSGIACEVDAYNHDHRVKYHTKNIRYSKSMILKALYFWEKQYDRYLQLLKKAQFNPLFKSKYDDYKENEALKLIMMVHNFPDTFLFSHRYIQEMNINHYRSYGGKNPAQTNHLLNKKYNMEFRPQEQTMQHFARIKTNVGIEFTVFPNEHPYIQKQKITRVGMTDSGNVFVLHGNNKK
jgi:hypothetical protein